MTIKLKLTHPENCAHYGVAAGSIITLDMEGEYLPICIASEIYETNSRTPMEAKKAQAIAARTYLAAHVLAGTIIDDTTKYQAFRWKDISTLPNCLAACEATAGQVLTYGGKLITAWYSASNGGRTKSSGEVWGTDKPWTDSIKDIWDTAGRAKWGEIPASHGVGMSQVGACYAAFIEIPYQEILSFYYPGTGISVLDHFGGFTDMVEKGEGESEDRDLHLHQLIFTSNDCYKAGKAFQPKGIMVHSTGANNPNLKRYVGPDDGLLGKNTNNNHWNQPMDRQVCVHAFIGKLADGTIATYQTLPWNMRGWHSGSGNKGNGNDTLIGFEICEDGLSDAGYFQAVYREAVALCAYLCGVFGFPISEIIGHNEGYNRGIASNHADPEHWFKRFGKSMDTFRADVQNALENGTNEKEAQEMKIPYVAKVKTKTGNGISLWNDSTKTRKVWAIPENALVEVIGGPDGMGFMLCIYAEQKGVADGQYLIPMKELTPEPEPEPGTPPLPATGNYAVVISTYQGKPLNAQQAGNILDDFQAQGYGAILVAVEKEG